jgi:DNA replication protein DnaC
MTNEKSCILAGRCKLAATPQCNRQCEHFIKLHGASGEGGRVGSAGLPRDYRLVTLSNSPARASQAAVYANLENYVKTFERQFDPEDSRQIKSLYLYSQSPGTGKTTTAAAVLNEWIMRHYHGSLVIGDPPKQMPAFFLDVNEWQTLYNEFNRPRVPDSIAQPAAAKYYRAMEKAKKAPYAVLDDIGVRSNVSDGFRGDLHAIINYRVTNQMPTCYTSNLPMRYKGTKDMALMPHDLVDVFGEERLVDRIGDQCSVQSFVGESKRGRR